MIQKGVNTTHDLEELWPRMVFFVGVSSVDEHLRKQGFVLGSAGWSLSPAYDMNPVATGSGSGPWRDCRRCLCSL